MNEQQQINEAKRFEWKHIVDDNGNCYCLRDESLSTYVIYYHDPVWAATAPAAFMKRYSAWVSSVDAMLSVTCLSKRIVRAFTIGDAFQLVAWEMDPKTNHAPRHRITNENGFEITGCTKIVPQVQKDLINSLWEEFERTHAARSV